MASERGRAKKKPGTGSSLFNIAKKLARQKSAEKMSSSDKLKVMFDYFDKDKDGALNAEEFVHFVNKTLMDGDAEAQMTSDQFVEVARGMGADTRRGILLAQLSKSQDQDTIERAFKRFQICRDRETIVDGKAPQTEKKTLAADSASGRPSPDGVLMEGEIQKRGTLNKTYKRRHFKLQYSAGRSFLVYYKKKGDKTPNGQILLDAAAIELDERNPKNWRVQTSKRTFYLKSANPEERRQWCLALANYCGSKLDKGTLKSLKELKTYAA